MMTTTQITHNNDNNNNQLYSRRDFISNFQNYHWNQHSMKWSFLLGAIRTSYFHCVCVRVFFFAVSFEMPLYECRQKSCHFEMDGGSFVFHFKSAILADLSNISICEMHGIQKTMNAKECDFHFERHSRHQIVETMRAHSYSSVVYSHRIWGNLYCSGFISFLTFWSAPLLEHSI